MGSRIMHLAIADSLWKELPCLDRSRFLLGSLLPDAAEGGNTCGHWRIERRDGMRTYDLTGLRKQYGAALKRDPLYLGYYLHLIQDLMFRQFVYITHKWDPLPAGNVERLHRDYAILNSYLIEKYRLAFDAEVPPQMEKEPLLSGCKYNLNGFFLELQADFCQTTEGELFFFQKEMADEYIALSLPICRAEWNALQRGSGFLDETALAWPIPGRSGAV